MIDPVSGAAAWSPPRVPQSPSPANETDEGPLRHPEPSPLGAPGPPAAAADVAARYRSAAEPPEETTPARTEFWA